MEELRQRIHQASQAKGIPIWVDEIDNFRDDVEPSFQTVLYLLNRISDIGLLIVALSAPRHGSSIRFDESEAHVSYFEVELFFALYKGLPIYVFETEDFRPEPRLHTLIEILHRTIPRGNWTGGLDKDKLDRHIVEFAAVHQSSRRTPRGRLSRFVDGLFGLRGAARKSSAESGSAFQFFGGFLADDTVKTNEILVRSLLDQSRSTQNEEVRLAHLWLAFRELQGKPFGRRETDEYLPLWNSFFSEWASAGSWYGLHAHLNLAVLPALLSQVEVRRHMKELKAEAWRGQAICYPGGAIASARYSISQNAGSWRIRRGLLHKALEDLQREMFEASKDTTNLIAIRASIYRRLGAIGSAIQDYERVVDQRRRSHAPDRQIGEALSELGYAYLYRLEFRRGRRLLEEGVELMEADAARHGFVARARRKLAIAYALSGHPILARDELNRVRELAQRYKLRDQEPFRKQGGG